MNKTEKKREKHRKKNAGILLAMKSKANKVLILVNKFSGRLSDQQKSFCRFRVDFK